VEYDDFGALVRGRASALGIESCAHLQRLMGKHGVRVSHTAVSRWWSGSGGLRGPHLEVLLAVLAVYDVAQRERAHRMNAAPAAADLRPVAP